MTAVYTEPPSPYPDSPGPTTKVCAESPAPTERPPLSIGLDVPRSTSPFPSPSSSFLPPPIPANHEFAMRLPPSGRPTSRGSVVTGSNGSLSGTSSTSNTSNRNGSLNEKEEDAKTPMAAEPNRDLEAPSETKDSSSISFEPKMTPIPSVSPTPTPTPILIPQPAAADSGIPTPPPAALVQTPSATPTASSIMIPSTFTSTQNNSPTPNRPAPPSPAASRRVSSMSAFSNRSPAPTTSVSRANSVRGASRISASTHTQAQFAASAAVVVQGQNSAPRVLIHVRDFGFDKTDERFRGAGALVPRANHLAVLNRKLAGLQDDEDDEASENEAEGEDVNAAWDKLRGGWSLNGWGTYSNTPAEEGPSQEEINLNFGAEEYEVEGEEEPLYPGLYRAMYAFQPEGTAEMALVEDQVVRVIGRGGGVGWAVVIDEKAGLNEDGEPRHALVPEGYLEAVRLDWEDEPEEEAT